ncbi:MAG: hypothetical protein AABX34_07515, partial [Nanoarchaeota archaeon]
MNESRNIRYLRQTAGEYYSLERLLELQHYFTETYLAPQDLETRQAIAEYVGDLGFRRLTYFG